MKKTATWMIAVVLGIPVLWPASLPAATTGESAALFEAKTLDGQVFNLDDSLGKKVVILNFWSVFCRDCIARIEAFNKMQQRFQKRAFVQVGICGDQESSRMQEQVKKYAARMEYPVVLDSDLRIYERYGSEIFPFVVVIGRDGKIALVIRDLEPGSLKTLNDKVDELTR